MTRLTSTLSAKLIESFLINTFTYTAVCHFLVSPNARIRRPRRAYRTFPKIPFSRPISVMFIRSSTVKFGREIRGIPTNSTPVLSAPHLGYDFVVCMKYHFLRDFYDTRIYKSDRPARSRSFRIFVFILVMFSTNNIISTFFTVWQPHKVKLLLAIFNFAKFSIPIHSYCCTPLTIIHL